ncbi:MAG TPA: hypothetical protein VF139_19635 [Candidatus Polarisedimenticolaceae bacterium]
MSRVIPRSFLLSFAVLAATVGVAADPEPKVPCGEGGAVWAAMTTGPAETREAATAEFAKAIGAAPGPIQTDDVPACPELTGCYGVSSCGNSTPCRINGESSSDTGSSSCVLPGGQQVNCFNGKTIHVLTGPCTPCPCCTQGTCMCTGSCPNYQSFRCE